MKKQLIIIGIIFLLVSVGLCGCFEEGIKTTTMSVEEIKNNARKITYDELMRNNDNYKGMIVYFRGKVVQVQEVYGDEYNLRVATRAEPYLGYYEDIIYVNYKGSRLLENDIVDIWGYVKGLMAYNAVLGNQITIPELDAYHLEIVKKAGE